MIIAIVVFRYKGWQHKISHDTWSSLFYFLTSPHILFRSPDQSIRRTTPVGSSPRPLRIGPRFHDRACNRVYLEEILIPNGGKVPWRRLLDVLDFQSLLDIQL